MADRRCIAGVVLAGGRSSRMGADKALLDYNGVSLVDHMAGLLNRTGLDDVYVSGRMGETCARSGCRCLQDSAPFAGPAAAIRDVLGRLVDYEGVLFVPVDMPFLTPDILQSLLRYEEGAQYIEYPLPLYLPTGKDTGAGKSVRQLAESVKVKILPFPEDKQECFANFNTPEQWQEAIAQ